ncbi:MAG: hypothetical protein JWQ38_3132 [Flavipsychrobacter sp.]|nr:hypothetical protein [Flavipsychrobacter sp.]
MKKVSLFLVSLVVCKLSFGKAVNEQAAKMTGYNFLKTEGVQVDPSAMSLVYKTTSTVKGEAVTDFYVFSTGNTGFIIVSGDDNVTPVLGYSTEDAFRADNIPGSVNDWLNNYKDQINYTIEHDVTATDQTMAQWTKLQTAVTTRSAAKTTGTAVAPFLKTKWGQGAYYNDLCPFDVSADTNVVTGCVATAMAMVMKFWSWPNVGKGTHSYNSGPYGMLTANYGTTTYVWDSMPNSLTKPNSYVATLMSQAGISVNMSYSPTSSGAFVTVGSSPIVNCAEYAMKTYFNYRSTLKGYSRYAYDDSEWVGLIKNDLDNKWPVIHTGSGASGGHCFLIDGYTTGDKLHVNWGWGGFYNGYFVFDNLSPSTSETFNDNQTIILGVIPNNPATLGVNEVTGTTAAIYPNPAKDVINIDMQQVKATKITLSDMQGRILKTITPDNTIIATMKVSDLSAGIYLVSLETAEGVETRKVVIE